MKIAIGPSSFAQADPKPLALLEAAGCEVKPNPFGRRLTEEEIITHLEGVDGLIAGLEPLNAKVIASAPQLKAIARVGIGVANVDFDAAAQHEVKVSYTPDEPTAAVAELSLAAALHLCRALGPMNAAIHEGGWKKMISPGVAGQPVLIVGYGRIGRRTADLFRAVGAEILVADPFLEPGQVGEGAELVELKDGLARAGIISLHAAGEDVIIGGNEFAAMREGAVLLNSARGGLVDQDALIAALDDGPLAGAWFDAFWTEPYEGPLQGRSDVLLTPHASTYTTRCRLGMESKAVENLLADLGLNGG